MVPGTVLGELKLSTLLSEELERVKREMRAGEVRMREAEQAKVSLMSELRQERQGKAQLQTDVELLRYQLLVYERSTQQTESRLSLTSTQLSQYQDLYHSTEAACKRLTTLLHEEKWRNDIRFPPSVSP